MTDTLTMPTREMVELLRAQVFTDSGRFYPCRANPACSAWGRDIALSNPSLSIDGPRLVFSVHLVGSYPINQFFTPTVIGDLVVSGVPIVRGNKIALSQSAAGATPTSDVTFRAFLEATHTRVETMLDQSAGFDLPEYLAAAASDPQLPPPRLPDVHCVDPSGIHVESVATRPAPAAVSAVMLVNPSSAGKC